MFSEMTRAGGRHVRVRRRSRSTSRRAVLIRVHANLDCELAALAAVDHDRGAAGIRRRADLHLQVSFVRVSGRVPLASK